MRDAKPIFDPATHYRIEIRGRIDVEWLQSLGGAAIAICDGAISDGAIADDPIVDGAGQRENVTVLDVKADQAGIVGLVRRLHGLGITIQRFQIVEPS